MSEKLKSVINRRTICVIAHGKSISELESKIPELKDHDICWASLNLFTMIEEGILSKIGKHLDIVSDCSNVPLTGTYEPHMRIPRFETFLSRNENNLLFISNTVIKDVFVRQNRIDISDKYASKIETIDNIFSDPLFPKEVWEAPPNSITLLLAALICGMAKKIIIFGLDGFYGSNTAAVNEYYNIPEVTRDRIAATGNVVCGSLPSDSKDFEKRFPSILQTYKQIFSNDVELVNCSPRSAFTCIRKIEYSQLLGELK